MVRIETAESAQTQSAAWRERALAAEARAAETKQAVQRGLIPWLKQQFVQKLMADRAELMDSQAEASRTAESVNQRLARIEDQIQIQNRGYEERITELTKELTAAKAENRELIQLRIRQVKAEMEAARSKMLREAELPEK
jgi:hypothetical protein